MAFKRVFPVEKSDPEYTGDHHVGEIIDFRGHECRVTAVWVDPDNGKSGVSIIPVGNYGFEIDVYEERL